MHGDLALHNVQYLMFSMITTFVVIEFSTF
jgi:hypothetical protein